MIGFYVNATLQNAMQKESNGREFVLSKLNQVHL